VKIAIKVDFFPFALLNVGFFTRIRSQELTKTNGTEPTVEPKYQYVGYSKLLEYIRLNRAYPCLHG
jgi:hypothetical protein